jgi:integrase
MSEPFAQSLIPTSSTLTVRFERQQAEEFARRSTSEQTRRAYQRVVREFFTAAGNLHPTAIAPTPVCSWRDALLRNTADTKFVPAPTLPETQSGRALTPEEVQKVLAGSDRSKVKGARDYALLLVLFRLGLRVAEACALWVSDLKWSHGRWLIKFKVKGGRERTLPLPDEVRTAIKDYLKLDAQRRQHLHSDGTEAYLFQPLVNYRTLEFAKLLSTRMVWNTVARWGNWGGVGKLALHDLRRTAITRALDQGLSYRQVQMMSGHKERYDHQRKNLDQNAINHLNYE